LIYCSSTPPGGGLVHCLLRHTEPPRLYTLSLHDALPISVLILSGTPKSVEVTLEVEGETWFSKELTPVYAPFYPNGEACEPVCRSEEHTSELQSRENLVCRLLLEKKNNQNPAKTTPKHTI